MDLIDKELESFSNSGRMISAEELANKIRSIRENILFQIEASPSGDMDGREQCYRELHGLKAVMLKLIHDT